MNRLFIVAILALLTGSNLSAHDFWLAASHAADGIKITGHVGEKFPVADSRTTPTPIDIWRVMGTAGDVTPPRNFFQDGESLATRLELTTPGTYLGIMTIRSREIVMAGNEFTDYLREEGLESVIGERARLNQTDLSARERYARYAKIVLRTGEGDAAHLTRPSGIKAEFVPAVNPTSLAPGAALSLQFLVEGRPVAGALIAAMSRDAHLTARTGSDGRATFTIPSSGQWLIKTVYMAKPTNAGEPPVDWESYWVTLTFEIQ